MKKSELIKLITECYNKLDNISAGLMEASEVVNSVLSLLEETPTDPEDIEDDEK